MANIIVARGQIAYYAFKFLLLTQFFFESPLLQMHHNVSACGTGKSTTMATTIDKLQNIHYGEHLKLFSIRNPKWQQEEIQYDNKMKSKTI